MDHYFPKVELTTDELRAKRLDKFDSPKVNSNEEIKLEADIPAIETKFGKIKSSFTNLFDSIKSRRDDNNVTATPIGTKPELDNQLLDIIDTRRDEVKSSPNVTNIGLQTPIQERLNSSPLVHKSSFNNTLEETNALFDDDPLDIGIDSSGESSILTTEPVTEVKPDDLINSFDKVEVKIDKNNHNFNIQLGELKQQVKHIHTRTNDGYLATFSTSDIVNDTLP
jgi:hypothetical protein